MQHVLIVDFTGELGIGGCVQLSKRRVHTSAQDLQDAFACVCVSVRSWGGDDASVCRLPFIEVPRVAAVFPSPQEMTRRVSG